RLIFKDDGPGMTEEVKAKLFQPFFTTKDPGEGTGLGLSVSHSIILEHNGTIEVESKLGIGTSFVIELPIASTSESETETPTVVPVTQSLNRKARILIVDDEPSVRAFIKTILTKNGHTAEGTGNPEEVLSILEQDAYDIIFLDVRMPGISGIELYDRIIQRQPTMKNKVIFVTGDTSSLDVKAYLANHNLLYITKPFDRKTLEDKVITLLSR
ncbi:MAG: response regulator, partial [Dehalococcoidia bacterium]